MLTALGADVGITVLPDSGHVRGVVLSETIEKDKAQALRDLAQMAAAALGAQFTPSAGAAAACLSSARKGISVFEHPSTCRSGPLRLVDVSDVVLVRVPIADMNAAVCAHLHQLV